MRYKVVPPVRDRAFLLAARDALPLVPDSVEDCCTRIRDATAVPSRDEARETLTFLQALGLAAESDRGFHRTRDDPESVDISRAFRANVFGVRELLAAVDEEPLTAAEAFAALRDRVPRWERDRSEDWEARWRERTERLLGWAVVFGLVERDGAGYRATERRDGE